MKNEIRRVLKSQDWVPGLLANDVAVGILEAWHARLPTHVQLEIAESAFISGASVRELIACNFAYEVSMLAAMLRGNISEGASAFDGIRLAPMGCTTCTIMDFDEEASGLLFPEHVHFGRNFDWPDADDALMDTVRQERKPSNDVEGDYNTVTFPGFSGVFTGYAPRRFAAAMNAVMTGEAPLLTGASPAFLLREVMDSCETFEDALKLLSETPLITSVIFTLVSAHEFATPRHAVVIERSPTRCELRYPQRLTERLWGLVATNTAMEMASMELEGLSETSCARYDTAMTMVSDYADIGDILEECDFGLTIYSATADLVIDQELSV